MMLEIKDLVKSYGSVTALEVDHLKIEKGESFGLVGNNGAGKTTMFSLILDLIKADKGSVFSKGENVKLSDHWKAYTTSYIDESFLIDFLTPDEYFEFIGKLHGLTGGDLEGRLGLYSDFCNGEILNVKKYIRELSKGNQKKVGIVGTLLASPEVIVLDEPFPHLDPTSVIRLKKILRDLKEKGVTILISSHDLNHVTDICERIVLLEKGRVIKDIATSANTLAELEKYFSVNID